MKLKELIEKFEERKTIIGNYQGYAVWWEDVKEIFEQLDEPQPVKIPQCVADWIEECKKKGDLSLGGAIKLPCPEIYEWLMDWENQELFAQAWIFGYEVEEEKRYTVVTKATKQPLYYNAMDKKIFFSMGGLATNFTRKQLEEAGFGWVFDCPGIEVEEVE